MGNILVMKELKNIVRGHKKQASKEFFALLDDTIRRKIDTLISTSRSKRLSEGDITLSNLGGD